MPLLLNVDVADRMVVVVGGGPAGVEKAGRLLEAGARIRVVDPDPPDDLDPRVELVGTLAQLLAERPRRGGRRRHRDVPFDDALDALVQGDVEAAERLIDGRLSDDGGQLKGPAQHER